MHKADLCIIGGGGAGLATAMAGVALGLEVMLIEKAPAAVVTHDSDLILQTCRAEAAAGGVFVPGRLARRVERVLAAAAPDRRMERLAAMNVRVCIGQARFTDRDTVTVGFEMIRARRFVIATGANHAPAPPSIPADCWLDAFTLYRQASLPEHLLVVGNEARAVSIAQSYRSFGASVTLLCPQSLLPDLDEDLVAPLRTRLRRQGVVLVEGAGNDFAFVRDGAAAAARLTSATLSASHILVEDHSPALSDLDLASAGIATAHGGLVLTQSLRTTNRRVFAVGTVTGARSAAAIPAQVAVFVQAAFFRVPARFDPALIPVTTWTDPEIAAVGLSERAARERGPVSVWRAPLAETTAARLESVVTGHVKVVSDKRGRVLGAGIVGAGAAEQIGFWSLAVASRATMQSLAKAALPAETFAAASRGIIAAAGAVRLRAPRIRRLLSLMSRLD